MKLLALLGLAAGAQFGQVEFGIYDHAKALPGWQVATVAQLTKYKAALVAEYNKNKGLKLIKPFKSGNCCFAVAGGMKLKISGTKYPTVFPAATSGGLRCSPKIGYSEANYQFYKTPKLSSLAEFKAAPGCATKANPGIFIKFNLNKPKINSGVRFTIFDYQVSPGAQWRLMKESDFKMYKNDFVTQYNTKKGIPVFKSWISSNCCVALKGGLKLKISGTKYGFQFPSDASGKMKCNPATGYADEKLQFFASPTLKATQTFTAKAGCSNNHNPGVYIFIPKPKVAIEFGLFDAEVNPGGGWKLLSSAELNKHKSEFVTSYNTNMGINLIKSFKSKNCCFAVRGGKLNIVGTKYGYQFPATKDQGIRCNPSLGYTLRKYQFYQVQTLKENTKFTTGNACATGHNPAIYARGTKVIPAKAAKNVNLKTKCDVTVWSTWSACTKTCGVGKKTRKRAILKSANDCPALKETVKCSKADCPVHCSVSAYGAWSTCNAKCGNGEKHRKRKMLTRPTLNGNKCPHLTEFAKCNTFACKVHCQVSAWSKYNLCNAQCGTGYRTRTRNIIVDVKFGGSKCPALKNTQKCNTKPCKVHCAVNTWSRWTKCSAGCGGGVRERKRVVKFFAKFNGDKCPHLVEKSLCNMKACPTHCQVTAWSVWSACSKKCGSGVQNRLRKVVVEAANGGDKCPAVKQSRKCNTMTCPINCKVGSFGAYSKCTKTCGTGSRFRTRKVIRKPNKVGKQCPALSMTTTCSNVSCPVDCKINSYSVWGKCSKACGLGFQVRTRKVKALAKHGGKACKGQVLSEKRNCDMGPCAVNCLVSKWTAWTACSKTCGKGAQKRSRKVTRHAKHGGYICPALAQKQECLSKYCPVHCKVSVWSKWIPCTKQCGGGRHSRTRKVLVEARHSGKACGALKQGGSCNVQKCPVNCVMDEWKAWTKCTLSCGRGSQKRARGIVTKSAYGGRKCGAVNAKRDCNAHKCPMDCKVTKFGSWTPCSRTCKGWNDAGGVQTRERSIQGHSWKYGGKKCPALSQSRKCNTQKCPYDCELSKFSKWSACSKTCGLGSSIRTRKITAHAVNGGKKCKHLSEKKICEAGLCPYDCKVGSWSIWSACSTTCGKGTQFSTRKVVRKAKNSGRSCPSLKTTRDCNIKACPVHCGVGSWTPYSACNVMCGNGSMKRARKVVQVAAHGGKKCPPLTQSHQCFAGECAVNCKVSEWSAYSTCSKVCGVGNKSRTRSIMMNNNNGRCPGLKQTVQCRLKACAVDCTMHKWGKWATCSKSCAGGKTTRTRKIAIEPRHGGKKCGVLSQSSTCKTGACPINCKLTPWGLYTKCTKSCGKGVQYRYRILSVKPLYNGKACGAMKQQKMCKTQACPADCKVSNWAKFGKCSKSCGSGGRMRYRKVLTQPVNGGKNCPVLKQWSKCAAKKCPVHCLTADWSFWTSCSATCGGGKMTHTRIVTQKAAHGGMPCPALKESKKCNKAACPRDCKLTKWGAFSACTLTCGMGTHKRTRKVTVLPKFGGKKCPELFQYSRCNTQKCPVDCEVGTWGPFGACSKSCGIGTRKRYRTLLAKAQFGGKKCGLRVQVAKCARGHCPVGCKVSKWSKYSACSKTCGVGTKTATRKVLKHNKNRGYQCPSLRKKVQCQTKQCPLNCKLSASWGSFKECSVTCGGGYKSRFKQITRKQLFGGVCKHAYDTQPCNPKACPVDCKVSAWTKYGSCSKTCGKGTHIRTRVVVQKQSKGGHKCPHTEEEKNCAAGPCPVHCEYSTWSKYSKCSKTCGSGTRTRTRKITKKPKNGGIKCAKLVQTGSCSTFTCPADCKVGKWTKWSTCTRTCGLGLQQRTRKVTVEALNGGKLCPAKWQSKKCMVKPCPVHCKVSKWNNFDKCSQQCGGGLQIATRKVLTFPKLGGDVCPILQKVQRCNYQTCKWTELKAPKTKTARKYTVHYTTGSLKYADSKGAIKVALVGTKGRSKYYTIGNKFVLKRSGATTIKMNEDIGLLFGISLQATSADGWNSVNFINVDTPSKQTVQFRTDYWMTTKKHKAKLAYKTYPYASKVGIKAVNSEEGLKKASLSAYKVTYTTGRLAFADSKAPMFIQLQGSLGKSKYYKLANQFRKGTTVTKTLLVDEHVGLLKSISLEAGGVDAWHVNGVSVLTPAKQAIKFNTDFWLDDQPMHGKQYLGKHFYYQKEVNAVKREIPTKLTNIYAGKAEVKLPTRAPTVAPKAIDFKPLIKKKTGLEGKTPANKIVTAFPTAKPTRAPTRAPKKQCLNGAAFVAHGWNGAGSKGNYCNFCKCNDGTLKCTKRKCGIPTRVPARAKTCSNVKCAWTMQVRGKNMKAPKHHIEVSHHHSEAGPNHRCAFNAATKKCTCYCWGKATPTYATTQKGRRPLAKRGFTGTQCTDMKFKTPFDPSKGKVNIITSVTHMSPTPKWEHDAPISWVEKTTATGFRVCARESKNYWHSFDKHNGKLNIDFYATQSQAPWKGAELKSVAMPNSKGRVCKTIKFKTAFTSTPFVVGGIDHRGRFQGKDHHAMTSWIENINQKEFKVCFRETLFNDDAHLAFNFNYLAFTHSNPALWYGNQKHYAGAGRVPAGEWKLYPKKRVNGKNVYLNCKDVKFATPYIVPPTILVTANHQNDYDLDWAKTHDALMTYVDDVYKTHFKVCTAELDRHDGKHAANVNFDWVAFLPSVGAEM